VWKTDNKHIRQRHSFAALSTIPPSKLLCAAGGQSTTKSWLMVAKLRPQTHSKERKRERERERERERAIKEEAEMEENGLHQQMQML